MHRVKSEKSEPLGFFVVFFFGAPIFFSPLHLQPYCTYTCKCSILMELTFHPPAPPHCSHKYRAVKMQSSWSELISDTLSGTYYRLRCSPVLDAAEHPPQKMSDEWREYRARRVCVCVGEGFSLPLGCHHLPIIVPLPSACVWEFPFCFLFFSFFCSDSKCVSIERILVTTRVVGQALPARHRLPCWIINHKFRLHVIALTYIRHTHTHTRKKKKPTHTHTHMCRRGQEQSLGRKSPAAGCGDINSCCLWRGLLAEAALTLWRGPQGLGCAWWPEASSLPLRSDSATDCASALTGLLHMWHNSKTTISAPRQRRQRLHWRFFKF